MNPSPIVWACPAETFTAKPIKLDQMRKLLSGGRTPKVAERHGVYRTVKPYDPWFQGLRQRWQRSPSSRDEIRIAVRVLFGSEPSKVLDWLEEK